MGLNITHGHPELSIASNLVGMGVDLPAPLRKAADAALMLRLSNVLVPESLAAGQSGRDTLRLDLGNIVTAQFLRDVSGEQPHVIRGGLGVVDGATPPAGGGAAHNQPPRNQSRCRENPPP